ncbi:MAG: hypothetical protein ABI634_19365 [Acidobacteriota bacterium]
MPRPAPLTRRAFSVLTGFVLLIAATGLAASGCKKKSASPTTPTPVVALPNTVNPGGSTNNVVARTSMRTPANSGSLMYDDFVSGTGTTITRVSWQGIYCAEVLNRVAPTPTATGFQVAFFPDNGNTPNRTGPIQSVVYPIARTGETLDFTFPGNCGATNPTGFGLYTYSVTLDTPFVAQPDVRYWVSVQAQVNYIQAGNPDFVLWGWRDGTANNNRSIQANNVGTLTEYAADRAFNFTTQ